MKRKRPSLRAERPSVGGPLAPRGHVWIARIEWLAAALLTVGLAVLHFINLRAAGGLWRDEAAALHLATMPTFGDIWRHLEHESFPLLLTLLLRGWSGLAAGDLWLRTFGLLVGLAIVAALWWSSWRLAAAPPLLSLLLFGFSSTVIRWGDSLRAYGLGVVFILLAFVAVWSVVQNQSRRNVVVASLIGILAVQTLYQNAYLLAAICAGGVATTAWRRNFRGALVVIGLGIPAALSLLVYRGVIARASDWNVATQVPFDLARISLVLHRALADRGPLSVWLWAGLALAALVSGIWLVARRKERSLPDTNREAAVFLIIVPVATTLAYYAFLRMLKFPTEVWYYLVGLAIFAVAIDALLARASRNNWFRSLRVLLAVFAAAFSFPAVAKAVQVRMTNLDLVAARLNEYASEGDLIIVHPWFCGASLSRYYSGKGELTTLPPLADMRLQRLDLFKEQMKLASPVQPVLTKIEAALRANRTVWLVGYFPFANPPRPPPNLPHAGEGPEGWRAAPYMTVYGMEVAYFLQYHAERITPVEVPVELPVNPFENFPIRAVRGWHY